MNAEQEREHILRGRYPKETAELLGASPYRTHSVIVQVVFFILTCLGVGATYLFFEALSVGAEGLVTGVAAIVLAEVLIRNRKWFFTGVEAALWIGGLLSMISELPSSGSAESLLVVGSAFAIAGVRVRNPLFGAIAAGFVVAYAERVSDLGTLLALLLAFGASLALLRVWQRASTEWLFIAIAVLGPIAARVYADERWEPMTIALYLAFGVVTLSLGLLRRHHALVASGAIEIVIAMVYVGDRLPLLLEAQLAIAGALLLGGSIVISRALRERTTGIVVAPVNLSGFDEAIESAGAIAAAHAARPADAPASDGRVQGEGRFGGAGASDSY